METVVASSVTDGVDGQIELEVTRTGDFNPPLAPFRDRLLVAGIETTVTTPEQFGEYVRAEVVKWAKVVKAAGIQPQSY